MKVEPVQQHHWLKKLVGDWTFEHDCPPEEGKPAQKFTGSEAVRALGEVWVLCEGRGEMPGGGEARMMMTLGYDPQRERFVGTWIGSMMTHLWVYDGELNAAGTTLTLTADGPDFNNPGKMATYRDVIEFKSDNHRTLTSYTLGPDGKWTQFMTSNYRRK